MLNSMSRPEALALSSLANSSYLCFAVGLTPNFKPFLARPSHSLLAARSATVLIHVDKSKLARSAAACSIFNCPTLTLILIINVFRSPAAFIGVFFIDGILSLLHNVATVSTVSLN
jgi:hypothetical protein